MPYTKVMHKWGEGSLHSGGKHGPTVPHTKAGQKQALAIMYSEKRRGTTDAEISVGPKGLKRQESPKYTREQHEGAKRLLQTAKENLGKYASFGHQRATGIRELKRAQEYHDRIDAMVKKYGYRNGPEPANQNREHVVEMRSKDAAMGCDCWEKLVRGWCKGAKDARPSEEERVAAQRQAFGFATGTGKPSEKSTLRPPTPPKKISKTTGNLLRGWRNEPLSKEYTTKDAEPFHTPSGGVSEAGRERAEAKGQTMRGGRFPIRNLADLAKAKHDVGRAKDPAAVRRWINKRAEELGGKKLGEAKDSGGAGLSAYMQNKGVTQGQATKAVSKQPRLKKWSPPTVREVER